MLTKRIARRPERVWRGQSGTSHPDIERRQTLRSTRRQVRPTAERRPTTKMLEVRHLSSGFSRRMSLGFDRARRLRAA